MTLRLTNPRSILKDGGNLVRLSSGDDFWKQLPLLLFFKSFLVFQEMSEHIFVKSKQAGKAYVGAKLH